MRNLIFTSYAIGFARFNDIKLVRGPLLPPYLLLCLNNFAPAPVVRADAPSLFHGRVKSSKYLAAASLRNPAGNVVAPNTTTVTSAINDFLSNSSYAYESLALGIQNHCNTSFSVLTLSFTVNRFALWWWWLDVQARAPTAGRWQPLGRSSTTSPQADFFYWMQTDSNASLADMYPPPNAPVPQTRSGES